jgi:hypothetical protein
MIDDWLQKRGRDTASAAAGGLSGLLDRYFGPSFRWVEFAASVGGSYAAVKALAGQMAVGAQPAHVVALVAAGIAAVNFLRNPKTREWVVDEAPAATAEKEAA